MGKFFHLILKNLGRNKLRTTLTALAVVALVTIYSFVSSVTEAANDMISGHSSETRLLVREKWNAPSHVPVRYVPRIAAVDGVLDWTTWNAYGGLINDRGQKTIGFATRPDNLRTMNSGLEDLDPALVEALEKEKTGALVGAQVAQKLGRGVGQTFTITSITHPGKNLDFKIVGLLPGGMWQLTFFFRRDYYEETTGDDEFVDVMWIQVPDVETGRRVAAAVEQMFRNSPRPVRLETESAGVTRFSGHIRTVVNIINFVAVILLANMVIAQANSISITVRERRKEMAILKVLGFQPSFILALIVLEAVVVGMFSGLVGASLAYAVSRLAGGGYLGSGAGMLAQFPVSANFIARGLVIGAVVGFAASVIPAWNVRKVHVAEVFVRV